MHVYVMTLVGFMHNIIWVLQLAMYDYNKYIYEYGQGVL
jgi:hypothetical protein